MFISKKRWQALVKRIENLEENQAVMSFDFGAVDLRKLTKIVEQVNRKTGSKVSAF